MIERDSRRRFTHGQRQQLFLAQDGQCANCGTPLTKGWHAHHVTPHAWGGRTDLDNGQPLCASCHQKIPIESDPLRAWQRDAVIKYFAGGPSSDFLVEAFPGTGKTKLALHIAREMLDHSECDRIAIIVPTDALREQWAVVATEFGLNLKPARDLEDYNHPGYHGCVATYAQLATGQGSELLRRVMRRARIFAVADELHHAGDQRAWGQGLKHALELAHKRLHITGTPWRADRSDPIPFVNYGADGIVIPDHSYGYAEGVRDGVLRHILFHAFDAHARWVDHGQYIDQQLHSPNGDTAMALAAALNPDSEWMNALLERAATTLDELRADIPSAGGLVIGDYVGSVRKYADILTRLSHDPATVVVSEDGQEAHLSLDRYRDSIAKWLAAIRMVSEGVDIPRLSVGIFASQIATPLFFRQVVGRFIRTDVHSESAHFCFPAIPILMRYAAELDQALHHQLELQQLELQRTLPAPGESGQKELDFREILGADSLQLVSVILDGDEASATEMSEAETACEQSGIPKRYARQVVNLLRRGGAKAPAIQESPKVSPTSTPMIKTERLLRAEIDTFAGKVARRRSEGRKEDIGVQKREINAELLRQGFPPRNRASIDELEGMRAYLEQWLVKLTK
jgi:superfamily II DNA or RNA helicase